MPALSPAFLLFLIFVSGCDSEVRSRIDRELRTDETRRAHAATYAGISTAQSAHRIAEAIANSADPGCSRRPPRENQFSLEIRRMRGDHPEVVFREERTYRTDQTETVHLTQDASFTTQHGTTGEFQNEILVVEHEVFLKDDRSDRWYRRDQREEARLVRALGSRSMQVLLDSLPGVKATSDGWVLGAKPLRCEAGPPPPLSDAWLARFEGRGEVVEATFEHDASGQRRKFRAVWELDQGRRLVVKATEIWSYEPVVDMLPPDEEVIVDVERDRALYLARSAMKKMIDEQIVEKETSSEN